MKYVKHILSILLFVSCITVVLMLISCEQNHFANPLPVDSKNIYTVPQKLRGYIKDEEGNDFYLLEKNSITIPDGDTIKIINGIWFHPRDTARTELMDSVARKKIENTGYKKSRYRVHFDSARNPIDTLDNYIIKGGKIYEVTENGLDKGFTYFMRDDTLYLIKPDKKILLNDNAFFRKVDNHRYLLNIKDSELEIGTIHWWHIYLLEAGKDGDINLYEWNDMIKADSSFIAKKNDEYFFNSQWTRSDILRLIDKGAFDLSNPKKRE